MLDSLVETTGYARTYAIGLLNQETPGPLTIRPCVSHGTVSQDVRS